MPRYQVRCRFRELPSSRTTIEALNEQEARAIVTRTLSARALAQLSSIETRTARSQIILGTAAVALGSAVAGLLSWATF